MNIYSILQLCGGLAFFLFGMHVMSGSLEKLAGGNLQKILKEVTSNPIKSLFFGAIVPSNPHPHLLLCLSDS